MADNFQTQLVLSQNQHALVQDTTKGIVQVYAGPHSGTLSQTDRPVVYDRVKDEYTVVELRQAVKQNPLVGEGEYVVLENPTADAKAPRNGGNAPVDLRIGSKINVPGPVTFPLWPGQFATVVPGHHLRSNQYLIVRVYNAEEAGKNATALLKQTATGAVTMEEVVFTPGQLLVIKGTTASFFIPPTGFEVLKGEDGYVREALTLERLEYAILLDEDGNKRYERGPQVVFPEATEKFLSRADKDEDGKGSRNRKFKAIELNDQMGLYIKVIADYKEEVAEDLLASERLADATGTEYVRPDGARFVRHDGKVFRTYVTGEELFITGREQRIYYPRPEHALIGYDDPKSNFKRERYYGITIPKGEGRYVLDKNKGEIVKVEGPRIFLPDPRSQVIVRRVLDTRAVTLWYPGNAEALAFNQSLRALADESAAFLSESTVQSAMADLSRSINRTTSGNLASYGSSEQRITRGAKFTPPPMLTLDSKYDGVPSVNVWTGYAVQVVDRAGGRRVVVGPATILLQYDETLEMFSLSGGKPKTTDNMVHDVYLRVDHNLVSDIVTVQTKDFVDVAVKLSYRVNFLAEHKDKWFRVENYVKYLCDHMRSLLKAEGKRRSIGELIDNSTAIVRDTVLGPKPSDEAEEPTAKRHRFFPENGMDVYDAEVLGVEIVDSNIKTALFNAQRESVQAAITLSAEEERLKAQVRRTEIQIEWATLGARQAQHTYETNMATEAVKERAATAALEAELARKERLLAAEVVEQANLDAVHRAELVRQKDTSDQDLAVQRAQADVFKERVGAVTPDLIAAMQAVGDRRMLTDVTLALGPLALAEHEGLGQTVERVFKGTVMESVIANLKKE